MSSQSLPLTSVLREVVGITSPPLPLTSAHKGVLVCYPHSCHGLVRVNECWYVIPIPVIDYVEECWSDILIPAID